MHSSYMQQSVIEIYIFKVNYEKAIRKELFSLNRYLQPCDSDYCMELQNKKVVKCTASLIAHAKVWPKYCDLSCHYVGSSTKCSSHQFTWNVKVISFHSREPRFTKECYLTNVSCRHLWAHRAIYNTRSKPDLTESVCVPLVKFWLPRCTDLLLLLRFTG